MQRHLHYIFVVSFPKTEKGDLTLSLRRRWESSLSFSQSIFFSYLHYTKVHTTTTTLYTPTTCTLQATNQPTSDSWSSSSSHTETVETWQESSEITKSSSYFLNEKFDLVSSSSFFQLFGFTSHLLSLL